MFSLSSQSDIRTGLPNDPLNTNLAQVGATLTKARFDVERFKHLTQLMSKAHDTGYIPFYKTPGINDATAVIRPGDLCFSDISVSRNNMNKYGPFRASLSNSRESSEIGTISVFSSLNGSGSSSINSKFAKSGREKNTDEKKSYIRRYFQFEGVAIGNVDFTKTGEQGLSRNPYFAMLTSGPITLNQHMGEDILQAGSWVVWSIRNPDSENELYSSHKYNLKQNSVSHDRVPFILEPYNPSKRVSKKSLFRLYEDFKKIILNPVGNSNGKSFSIFNQKEKDDFYSPENFFEKLINLNVLTTVMLMDKFNAEVQGYLDAATDEENINTKKGLIDACNNYLNGDDGILNDLIPNTIKKYEDNIKYKNIFNEILINTIGSSFFQDELNLFNRKKRE